MENEAMKAGRKAFLDGEESCHCPHDVKSDEYDDWQTGYEMEQMDAES